MRREIFKKLSHLLRFLLNFFIIIFSKFWKLNQGIKKLYPIKINLRKSYQFNKIKGLMNNNDNEY